MKRGAIISDCGQFRYSLFREWDSFKPRALFIMLNPSTADADADDPTIRKCIGFAERLGFGGFVVVNLFAFRATQPAALKAAGYPVGDENDWHIWLSMESTDAVICAWGANARKLSRPAEVIAAVQKTLRKPTALKLTVDGIPCHPLMLPYTCELQPL